MYPKCVYMYFPVFILGIDNNNVIMFIFHTKV